jgi:sugar phosphate isomerase/epimerase
MKISQIAATLFTVRDFCKNASDLTITARKLRAIGYQAVQLSKVDHLEPGEIVSIMAGEGLTICSTHEPADDILEQPEKAIAKLQRLGCSLTAYPYPQGIDFGDPAGIKEFVKKLERSGARFRAAGITLGYHNHEIEFFKMEGAPVLEYIYAHSEPSDLVGELDTYWVHYGGGDCVDWCRRLQGRLPFIHLKDYAMTLERKPTYCEIGSGTLPFGRIVAEAERSGCQWFIVEQDTCPRDPFESLETSFKYLQANLVSQQDAQP